VIDRFAERGPRWIRGKFASSRRRLQTAEVPDYALPLRQAPGARPISRVNAREKVDSDS
jgi:hypothetical protein